jgi:hypothetical protein
LSLLDVRSDDFSIEVCQKIFKTRKNKWWMRWVTASWVERWPNEIEITRGLGARQEIIIGSYRLLRMLKDGSLILRTNERAQSRFLP